MNAERWVRLQSFFHQFLELAEDERAEALEDLRLDDPALAGELEELLKGDSLPGFILERDRSDLARDLLQSDPALLESIGPYRIDRLLGEGGMGVVYLARREEPHTSVAIKVLRDASLSPHRRERFAREQQTLARLDHPAIARFFDAGVLAGGTPYFVMEYVEGSTITDFCRDRSLPLADRLKLFKEACEAVAYANRLAIVHRDLKPSNIMVSLGTTAGGGRIKLLDFGIAKQLEALGDSEVATRTIFRLMTPAYASPEQIRGEPVGVSTDVYSLGVILYELLTGEHPFRLEGLTPAQVESVVSEGQTVPPSTRTRGAGNRPHRWRPGWNRTRGIRSDLDVICLTAMHPDPTRRYTSVEALLRDLEHLERHEPLDARPDDFRYRTGKFLRRNRVQVATSAAVVGTIMLLTGFYTTQLASARDRAVDEAARSERTQRFMVRLFEGGGGAAGPADTLRVSTLLARGVQEAHLLEEDPLVQAELFHTLGVLYQELGEFPRADSLLSAALARKRSTFGARHPEVARTLVAIGTLRTVQAELEEGERLIRDGLTMAQGLLPQRHPGIAEAIVALARSLQAKGDYTASIQLLEQSAGIWNGSGSTVHRSDALKYLADSHFYSGHYPTSDSLNHELVRINRSMYGARHPYVADAIVNLGASQFQLGNYSEAEAHYREALDLLVEYYGEEHPQTASGMIMLGQSLTFQDRYDEARNYLEPAVAVRERVFGPDHPRVASAVNELGTLAMLSGDLDTAASHYQRMVEIYTRTYDDRHFLIGVALANLASTYLNGEQFDRAEPIFREAIERFLDTLPPEHSHTAIARIKLGRVLVRQGRLVEALEPLLLGQDALAALANPAVSWLRNARTDLLTVYEALGDDEEASRFRSLLGAGDEV